MRGNTSAARAVFEGTSPKEDPHTPLSQRRVNVRGNTLAARAVFESGGAKEDPHTPLSRRRVDVRGNTSAARALFEGKAKEGAKKDEPVTPSPVKSGRKVFSDSLTECECSNLERSFHCTVLAINICVVRSSDREV